MSSPSTLHATALVVSLFGASLCHPTTLGAQQQAPIDTSAALPRRVRLRLPEAQVKGLAVGVKSDSLLLQTTDLSPGGRLLSQRWIPLDCVDRAEVSVGHVSRWRGARRWGVLGLLGGAGVGVLVAQGQEHPVKYPLSRNPLPASDNQRLLRNNVAIFGGAGLLLGGVVGYRLPTERWRRVDLRAMVARPEAPGAPNPQRKCPLAPDDQ